MTGQMQRAEVDEAAVRKYRVERIRAELVRHDMEAVLVVDPVNLRYATGSRNMQVWTMHNISRYALVFASGPVVLFELPTGRHLSESIDVIGSVRKSIPFDYMLVGENAPDMAARWARQMDETLREHGCSSQLLAVDRADTLMVHALEQLQYRVVDGKGLLEHARSVKSDEEIKAFCASLRTCENAVRSLYEFAKPGVTESQAFGHLLGQSVAQGGEYPETRLLSSGPRTNPWFQEADDRVMRAGDLLAFDTDLIGPMGFYNDISRTWVIGERELTGEQRNLFEVSRAQLEHNAALLKPGLSFIEYASNAYQLPKAYLDNRYADMAHGCGLGVEYPFVLYPEDADDGMYDGHFETNMIVCLESYVGELHGAEGVKLEQPVLVTETGSKFLSELPLSATDF